MTKTEGGGRSNEAALNRPSSRARRVASNRDYDNRDPLGEERRGKVKETLR